MVSSKTIIISSLFTREQGYTEINSNYNFNYSDIKQILHRYTPQGSSSQIAVKIGGYEKSLGTGYSIMTNSNTTRMVVFLEKDIDRFSYQTIPISDQAIKDLICDGRYIFKSEVHMAILSQFHVSDLASILYSILSKDNIIVYHENHDTRLKFFNSLLHIIPSCIIQCNTITTNCTELYGNKNIIGISNYLEKYKDHKKIKFPLDTILVNLDNFTVRGGGQKTDRLTIEIAELLPDISKTRRAIEELVENAVSNRTEFADEDMPLVNRIRKTLGYNISPANNWIMSF